MTPNRVQKFVHIIALPAFDYFTKYSNFGVGGKPQEEIELWCETNIVNKRAKLWRVALFS